MNAKAKIPAKKKVEHFQAIPLYTPEEPVVFEYFRDNLKALNAMTGAALPVILPETVLKGDVDDIYKAVESSRYPGLQRTDLPCLWIEGPGKKHFTLPLPKDNPARIVELMRHLSDLASKSNSVEEFREKVQAEKAMPNPLENRNLGGVFGLSFLALLALVLYGVSAFLLPRYASGVFVVAALALVALVPAVVLFKLFDTYASFSGSPFGMNVKFGGAAALWASVFIIGLIFQGTISTDQPTFTTGIYFHSPGSPNDKVPADGSVTLQLDEPKSVPIVQGYASVARLPIALKGRKVNFTLDLPGYELAEKGQQLDLSPDSTDRVVVRRSDELGRHNAGAFNGSIYFHLGDDQNAVVQADGSVTLQLDEPKVVPVIKGFASVANVPAAWSGRSVPFRLDLPGYRVAEKNATIPLKPDGRVSISVQPEEKAKP